VKIQLIMTAGLLDSSAPLPLQNSKDVGAVPSGVFDAAAKRLSGQIVSAFEKCRSAQCDLFGILSHLRLSEKDRFLELKHNALESSILEVEVRFRGVR
jgi:hypothetical protein